MFILSDQERSASYLAGIQALRQILQDQYGIDIKTMTTAVYSDWHSAIHSALSTELPTVQHFRSLQHVKRNITQNLAGCWVGKTQNTMLHRWVEFSAFIPNDLVFDILWCRWFDILEGKHVLLVPCKKLTYYV